MDFDKIDTSADPEQSPVSSDEPITFTTKKGSFTLTPKAGTDYAAPWSAVNPIPTAWESILSPVDLAIAWGKVADSGSGKYISFSQGNRWYFFKTKADSPLNTKDVFTHSGNNHIVPANENVRRAVRSIREKDRVILEGFLVDIKGTYKGSVVTWNTSLSRTDIGNGACEIFYVSKARIESKVYE